MAKSSPKKGTRKVCLYIEEKLLDKVKMVAQKEERSSSYMINRIIATYFEDLEWRIV